MELRPRSGKLGELNVLKDPLCELNVLKDPLCAFQRSVAPVQYTCGIAGRLVESLVAPLLQKPENRRTIIPAHGHAGGYRHAVVGD